MILFSSVDIWFIACFEFRYLRVAFVCLVFNSVVFFLMFFVCCLIAFLCMFGLINSLFWLTFVWLLYMLRLRVFVYGWLISIELLCFVFWFVLDFWTCFGLIGLVAWCCVLLIWFNWLVYLWLVLLCFDCVFVWVLVCYYGLCISLPCVWLFWYWLILSIV